MCPLRISYRNTLRHRTKWYVSKGNVYRLVCACEIELAIQKLYLHTNSIYWNLKYPDRNTQHFTYTTQLAVTLLVMDDFIYFTHLFYLG